MFITPAIKSLKISLQGNRTVDAGSPLLISEPQNPARTATEFALLATPHALRGGVKFNEAQIERAYQNAQICMDVFGLSNLRGGTSLEKLFKNKDAVFSQYAARVDRACAVLDGSENGIEKVHGISNAALISTELYKLGTRLQHQAWQVRKKIEAQTLTSGSQAPAHISFDQLPEKERIFSGMMGVSTMAILSQIEPESFEQFVAFGKVLQGQAILTPTNTKEHELTKLFLKEGGELQLPQVFEKLKAELHDAWFYNREVSFLMPEALQQPRVREDGAHTSYDQLPVQCRNGVALGLVSLAVVLAREDGAQSRIVEAIRKAQKNRSVENVFQALPTGRIIMID